MFMKTTIRFYSALGVSGVSGMLAIYELIPGITHPRLMGGATTSPAIGMAIICFALALIAGVIASMTRLRRTQE
jgi:hypothetical protein